MQSQGSGMSRVVAFLVLVPLGVVLVALAVANRVSVPFTIDPFNPGSPGLTVELPLFVYLFAALAAGLVLGAAATWIGQRRYRKLARERRHRAGGQPPLQPQRPAGPALPRPEG